MPLLVSGLSQNERQREGAEQVVEMPPLSCSARCSAFRAAQRLSVFGDLRKIIGSPGTIGHRSSPVQVIGLKPDDISARSPRPAALWRAAKSRVDIRPRPKIRTLGFRSPGLAGRWRDRRRGRGFGDTAEEVLEVNARQLYR
jgi:hypothetical protein